MKVATSPTREKFPLSTKKPLKKTIPSIFFSFILLFLFVLFGGLLLGPFVGYSSKIILTIILILIPVLAIYCVLMYKYQVWYFQLYFYDLTEDFVVIRKRVLTPREISIPYERIQDVYVDQDILDRIFGLYDVHLSSATISSGMEAHFDGVERPAAEGLRKMILDKVSEKIKTAKTG
ncbi:MAG: PH domain-containing protein [Candidatus Omnitrophica bacterium]|nr:PH domain-containing protein [Candidatus Omnitrophota bacterium]